MIKWLKFFCLSFFSHKTSKEGARRGYSNVLLGLILSFALLWGGFVGGDMLPLRAHYNNSTAFRAVVHKAIATSSIGYEIKDGRLLMKNQSGEYVNGLLVNTFESDSDRESYSVGGYNLIIDPRPADTLAAFEAYCLSNDGNEREISYEDYLTLSEVARLNFDFKLRYTGEELVLTDEACEAYRLYLVSSGEEGKTAADGLAGDLSEGRITREEYNRAIYKLYFTNYYPEITEYESGSEVPLLRNYYYHQYIKNGSTDYLFIFDDYMAASFETDGGISLNLYGFFSEMENGRIIPEGSGGEDANKAADSFVLDSFAAVAPLTMYANALNVFGFIPFIALMPMVVSLLAYSILKLRGVDSISMLGGAFKIVGSYLWFSALAAALLSIVCAFFISADLLSILPLMLFFIILAVRSIIFAVYEAKSYIAKTKEQNTSYTEA